MIWTIARKEWTERIRDGQFRIVSVSVATLLLLATLVGFLGWRQTRDERQTAQRHDRAQWLAQGSRNPHSAAHFGVYAFKPRLPLSFVDAGMESFTGAAIWVEAHYQNPARFRPAEDGTALQRFGELSAATVLQWFVPLLLILLSFSAFTGEKEQGTFRMLLSLGVPRGSIGGGKAAGISAALGCVLIPAAILGAAAMALSSKQTMAVEDPLRFLPIVGGYLIYLAVFVAVSLAVSVAVESSRAALAILLGFWAVSSFLIPRVTADAAEAIHPATATADFWREIATEMRGADGHSGSDNLILALKEKTLRKYGTARVEDLPINFEGLRLQAGEEHGNEVFDDHYGRLWAAYEAQERVHQWASIFSPLLAARSISMAMAGTDLAHLRHFTEKTESYRRALNKTMNLDVAQNSRAGQYYYFGATSLWQRIPEFRYDAPGATWALRNQARPIAILFAWLAVSLGALRFALHRVSAA